MQRRQEGRACCSSFPPFTIGPSPVTRWWLLQVAVAEAEPFNVPCTACGKHESHDTLRPRFAFCAFHCFISASDPKTAVVAGWLVALGTMRRDASKFHFANIDTTYSTYYFGVVNEFHDRAWTSGSVWLSKAAVCVAFIHRRLITTAPFVVAPSATVQYTQTRTINTRRLGLLRPRIDRLSTYPGSSSRPPAPLSCAYKAKYSGKRFHFGPAKDRYSGRSLKSRSQLMNKEAEFFLQTLPTADDMGCCSCRAIADSAPLL